MKIASHHDKQLTHPRARINTVFLILGLGYHQIQILGLEFLQCGGHQIRVNTWTGFYLCPQEILEPMLITYYLNLLKNPDNFKIPITAPSGWRRDPGLPRLPGNPHLEVC